MLTSLWDCHLLWELKIYQAYHGNCHEMEAEVNVLPYSEFLAEFLGCLAVIFAQNTGHTSYTREIYLLYCSYYLKTILQGIIDSLKHYGKQGELGSP